MAVHPAYQRNGIGSSIMREGLKRAREIGYRSVIVLGHQEFYMKFGFKTAKDFGIRSSFDAPEDVLFALELEDGSLKDVRGVVEYPKQEEKV
jgi:predicted N-acetyltransferase YhbS